MKRVSVALFAIMVASLANAQTLHLTFHSPAGEPVGGGEDIDIWYQKPESPVLNANMWNWSHSSGPDYLQFYAWQDTAGSNIMVATFGTDQMGQPLAPGTYLNAERAPFANPGHPGLEFDWRDTGADEVAGSFTIYDISSHFDGIRWRLDSFDADFTQYSYSSSLALTGHITYSSVPEPTTLLASVCGLALLGLRRRATKC